MRKRRVTEEMIRGALAAVPEEWHGKQGPALRYRYPVSGAVVRVDVVSGVIFHIGTVRFIYDD